MQVFGEIVVNIAFAFKLAIIPNKYLCVSTLILVKFNRDKLLELAFSIFWPYHMSKPSKNEG